MGLLSAMSSSSVNELLELTDNNFGSIINNWSFLLDLFNICT